MDLQLDDAQQAVADSVAAFCRAHSAAAEEQLDEETTGVRDHVVVIGFGQVGKALARHLLGLEIPVLVLDYNPRRVRESQARKLPVYFGNATRSEVLRAAHLGQARLAVVALPDPEVALRVVTLLKRLFPNLGLLVRAPDAASAEKLLAAAEKGGWTMVSMKNDWKTVFSE